MFVSLPTLVELALVLRAPAPRMACLEPNSNVLVVGGGPVQVLSAKLAAISGYKVTYASTPEGISGGKSLLWDETCPEGSLDITFLPIAGPDASSESIEAACGAAEGLIIAFDLEQARRVPVSFRIRRIHAT